MSSVRIKDGLVILDPLCHRLDFLPRWLCRIARRGQHAKFNDAKHKQEACLGRGKIGAANEWREPRREAFGVATPDHHDREAGIGRAHHGPRPRRRRRPAIGRQAFQHKSGQRG